MLYVCVTLNAKNMTKLIKMIALIGTLSEIVDTNKVAEDNLISQILIVYREWVAGGSKFLD